MFHSVKKLTLKIAHNYAINTLYQVKPKYVLL